MPVKDEIQKLKNLPPLTQQVCGDCKFYQKRESSYLGGLCHAAGGIHADLVWRNCQGSMWQPIPQRLTLRQQLSLWWGK